MGWQSYTVGFNTEEEKQSILDVIRKHNTSKDWDNRGEELFGIMAVQVKKKYKRGPLAHYDYFLFFGNGGGRQATYTFLIENWVRAVPFLKAHEDRCDDDTLEQIVLEYDNEV